jgi:hypothetical protein
MKELKYILLIFLFVQYGCKQKTIIKDPDVAICIDLDKKEDVVSYKDIFSKIEIIPLETNDESIFGQSPTHLHVGKDGSYYIYTNRAESIVIFDKNGAFIKHVNKKGQGPGEYTDISAFNINRFTGNLEILSPWGYIYVYDSIGTRYIETIKIGEVVHEFANLTDDIYAFYSKARKNNKILFYSKKQGKIINEAYPVPDFVFQKTPFNYGYPPFFVYRDNLCFFKGINGDVYTIDPETMELKLRYQWNFEEYNFDISLLDDNDSKDRNYYEDFFRYGNDKYVFCFFMKGENDNYFITSFLFRQKVMHIIYNKNNKKYLLFNYFSEGGDCVPYFINNEYIYAIYSPTELPIFSEKILEILDEEDMKKLKETHPEDNCVIIKYKFK